MNPHQLLQMALMQQKSKEKANQREIIKRVKMRSQAFAVLETLNKRYPDGFEYDELQAEITKFSSTGKSEGYWTDPETMATHLDDLEELGAIKTVDGRVYLKGPGRLALQQGRQLQQL